MRAPSAFFCSGSSCARPFSKAVSAPCLPRNFALASSSAAASPARENCALACASRSSTGGDLVSLFQIQTEPQRAPFAATQNRLRSTSQRGIGLGNHGGEAGFIVYSHVGQYFAIQFNRGLLRTGDEHAVRNTQLAACRVDAGDPESTEGAFLVAAIAIGILPSFHYRLFGDAEYITAAAAITFCCFDNFFVTSTGSNAAFYAWHSRSPVIKRKASLP